MATKLIGKIELDLFYDRRMLTEKYNRINEMRLFLYQWIDGCEIVTYDKYPNSLFYKKDGEVLFEKDNKNRYFWIHYDKIWSVFEAQFGLNYEQTQVFTKSILETPLKLEVFTTINSKSYPFSDWKHL